MPLQTRAPGKLRDIIAENVAILRKDMGLSQDQLAKQLKVTKQTVWRIESGLTNVHADMLDALAEALQADPVLLVANGGAAPAALKDGHAQRLDQVLECLAKATRVAQTYRVFIERSSGRSR